MKGERVAQIEFPWKWPRERNAPIYTAKVGNVSVPVYRYADGRFCVVWRKAAGAKREREMFEVKKEATDRADEVALALANSLADVVTLTSADRDGYRLAVQALAPLNIPLHAAIAEYVAAKTKLGPHTLTEAADYYVRGVVERVECPPTSKILVQLLAQLRDDRRDEKRYIRPLEKDLETFATSFPDLRQASEEAVREYLRGLKAAKARKQSDGSIRAAGEPVSARRRDNVRDGIVLLMRFARKKNYLPTDKTSAAEHIPSRSERGEVTTYTPEQVSEVLTYFATHDPDWLPWAAIAAFAGLRTSEIFRLTWEMVNWVMGAIAVPRMVARKVRKSRQTPILDPLRAWLVGWQSKKGPVVPHKWKSREAAHHRALARMSKALGWMVWETNALRHSFGSNRLAVLKSYEKVAFEMGNSPAVVREDYNDPKPESEGILYFANLPPDAVKNLVPFKTAV